MARGRNAPAAALGVLGAILFAAGLTEQPLPPKTPAEMRREEREGPDGAPSPRTVVGAIVMAIAALLANSKKPEGRRRPYY